MNSLKAVTLLSSIFIALVACTKNSTPDACTIQNPPETARIAKTHAIDFVLYPAYIPQHYTGCARVWLANGHLLSSFTFERGVVRLIEVHEPDKKMVTCSFDSKGSLVSGPQDDCTGFSDYPMWRKNADMGSN